MKKFLNLGKVLNKVEKKEINGGIPFPICHGTGTGGSSTEGYSEACLSVPSGTKCTINGYAAACSGNGGFWFY